MQYKVNVSYEESYTVIVEADTPQEAKELVELQLESDSLEAHPDRSTFNREWEVDTEVT